MSQREGPPRSGVSALFLRLYACATCSAVENEWRPVWEAFGRGEALNPPQGVPRYTGVPRFTPQCIRRSGWEDDDEAMESKCGQCDGV